MKEKSEILSDYSKFIFTLKENKEIVYRCGIVFFDLTHPFL